MANSFEADEIASAILRLYSSLSLDPPSGQYTILAAFVLSSSLSDSFKVISLSTGSKCLPSIRLPPAGDAVHDSHAEVLARRGAIRWFVEEVGRCIRNNHQYQSQWIEEQADPVGTFSLRQGVEIHLYISTVPCEILSSPHKGIQFLKQKKVATRRLATWPRFKTRTWPH